MKSPGGVRLSSYGSRSPWRVILRDEEAQRNPMSDRDMRVTRRKMMKVYMYIVQLNISKFPNSFVCIYIVQVNVCMYCTEYYCTDITN